MNWITRLIKKGAEAGKQISVEDVASRPINTIKSSLHEDGIRYESLHLSAVNNIQELLDWACDSLDAGQQALYLAQLCEEGLGTLERESILLTWPNIYYLNNSDDHIDSLGLLALPPIKQSTLSISEKGTLSDPDFSLRIDGVLDKSLRANQVKRVGAIFDPFGVPWMMTPSEWILVKKINDFSKIPSSDKSRKLNELKWGEIRPAAINAKASLSKYLKETVVLTKDSLDLVFVNADVSGIQMIEFQPTFPEAPSDWMNIFDRWSEVPEDVDFPTEGGSIQIIFSEPVREILQVVKAKFKYRRVTGANAQAFVRNPFSFLGEAAYSVLKEQQIQTAKESIGLVPTAMSFKPYLKGGLLDEVVVNINKTFQDMTSATYRESIWNAAELETLLGLMVSAVQAEEQFFTWRNHVVDIDGDIETRIKEAEAYIRTWKNQANNFIDYEDVYSLVNYGSQIEGIGKAKPIYSPYIQKSSGPWTPTDLIPLIKVELPPNGAEAFIQLDMEWVKDFEDLINKSIVDGRAEVIDPKLPLPLSIADAQELLKKFKLLINSGGETSPQPPIEQPPQEPPTGGPDYPAPPETPPGGGPKGPTGGPDHPAPPEAPPERPPSVAKQKKDTLLLKDRIGKLNYTETEEAKDRADLLKNANSEPRIPKNLRSEIVLKTHQKIGVAWLQHLFALTPHHVRGAILADDMGLGKTIQLLTVLAEHYEQHPDDPPSLIVAPIALMKNWTQEAKKFFDDFPEILLLHKKELDVRKQPKGQIDDRLQKLQITNLLKPNWLGTAKVVLTTYEVLRDYEFSLARQDFTFMICDEAQKIKTPNAMITLAAKKQKAFFRIACTGTPVENSLADLWCLFDFIQPGLLGSLEEFGKKYRKPIESKTEEFKESLNLLRSYIEPQILRRMKTDIAAELPAKINVSNDKYFFEEKERDRLKIAISAHQRGLYAEGLRQLEAAAAESNAKRRANMSFAVLHFIKAVCAEPYCLPSRTFEVDKSGNATHLFNSPKLKWLLAQLRDIQSKGEKAIIFTEIREIQRALTLFIRSEFGFIPRLINGDVDDRQDVIDEFQAKPGFGAIILSPLAAGFGLNIVEANHVIHYSRTWNPAKEGQATDRAYRIGQKRDVYVYCPTIVADDFVTFEDKLDRLMTIKSELAGDMLDGVGADIAVSDLFPTSGPNGEARSLDDLVDIKYVDQLDGDSFEVFCKHLFGLSELRSEITEKGRGDGGVDVVVIKNDGTGMLVQCKHTSTSELGWDAVKEIAAGSPAYQAKYSRIRFERVAICNKRFNSTAKEQANILGVRLIERPEIEKMLESAKILKRVLDEEVFKALS
jgi:SNF2-related domain/Restriction endonuclease/Helicase conserved C-terminal domain